jgi:type I restriction enzyme S subunit
MAVKPGYKQTEIGVIPEDWEAATIGEVATFSGGSQPPRSTFKFAPAKGYVRLIQIRDYKTDDYASFIPESMVRKRCAKDDIMIGRYGPPVFQILRGIEGAYNVALIKATPNHRVDREFFFYVLSQEKLFELIDSLSRRSSGQTGIEMPALKSYGLALPSLPEQRAIATALNDVDALLVALEQLFAKKRDLKQAAMQQLLTGQTRLPGFHGDWEVKRLGDLLTVRHGKSQHDITAPDGKYPILASGGEIGRTNTFIYDKPSVLIGRKGTIDSPQYVDSPFWTVDTLFFTEIADEADAKFVFYKFTMIRWRSYNEASGVPSLNAKTIENIEIQTPHLPEQIAIAAVLSDMDAELAVLEQRLAKTRALKQGMMQELLTGRPRLI